MATDKQRLLPEISILMAVYNPRLDWLRVQLKSLNAQTYPRLRLYIRDDCSSAVPFAEVDAAAAACITAFPYTLSRNEQNLGSNGTFERLTQEAEGDLFAYCDQDDEWLPEKLEALEKALAESQGVLAYSDVSVMDGAGSSTAESLRVVRPRLRYLQGSGLAAYYAFANCTAGCTMLVVREVAKQALPFPLKTVCDQWLCMVAAHQGELVFLSKPLMRYRIHGGNQTGILTGVEHQRDYFEKRLLPMEERVAEFDRRFGAPPEMKSFAQARMSGRIGEIWKYRALSRKDALFEIGMRLLPDGAIRWILRKVRTAT